MPSASHLIRTSSSGKATPGHLDILASFSLAELSADKPKHPEFRSTPCSLGRVFNVELLNKRFYRELASWYFWALPQVDFPADIEKDDETPCHWLIRLLTRLIFCWFLKGKRALSPRSSLPRLI